MKIRLRNPISLIFGPIFQKEVRVVGRRRGTYIARSFFALGLLAILSLFFMMFLGETHSGGIYQLQALQELAPILTLVVVWFQFIILALIAPMLTSDAISEERRARTLSALLTTPLTASDIVFGKLSSRLVQIVILALISLPLLLGIRVFGGFSAEVLLAATLIILSTALLGASLGLMFSLWTRPGGRTTAAAMQGVFALLVVQFGPLLAEWLRLQLMRAIGRPGVPFADIGLTSSPLVMIELTESTVLGTGIRNVSVALWPNGPEIAAIPIWIANSAYNIAAAIAIATLTSLVLRRAMRRMANEAPPVLRRRRLLRRRVSAPAAAAPSVASGAVEGGVAATPGEAPAAQPVAEPSTESVRNSSRTIRGNPILWREIRQQTLGSRKRLYMAFIAAALGFALLYWRVDVRADHHVHVLISFVMMLIILLTSAYSTSGTISSERDERTWDALLATPLTPRQIILGKFVGALRSQWFFLSLLLAHFVMMAMAEVVRFRIPVYALLILLGPIVLLTSTGQFFALAFRRGITAAAVNLVLGLVLFAGTWMCIGGIAIVLRGDDPLWFERLADFAFATNPFTLLSIALQGEFWGRRSGYELMYAQLTSREYTTLVFGVCAGYLALSAGVLALTSRMFGRLTGRAG